MTERHTIPPVFDRESRILILGSFPSVRSREVGFFYGHPQNRFWRTLSSVLNEPLPTDIEEKKALLLSHRIALWDVIASCEITGSSDSSIRSVVENDLSVIFNAASIEKIYTNGATAHRLYCRHQRPHTEMDAICLPSTSAANAKWTQERLTEAWRVIKK